jgi:hypothetical protein
MLLRDLYCCTQYLEPKKGSIIAAHKQDFDAAREIPD